MSDVVTMLNEIRAGLGSAVSPSINSASAASDVFEAYIFSLVVRAARAQGASITYEDILGRSPTVFIFRTSPGDISSTTRPYTHAVLQFPNKPPLEAHIGIYVEGKSHVRHECDVAVLFRSEAQICRQNQRLLPRHNKVLLSVECKFYSSNIPLGLARSFLGLRADISYTNARPFFVLNTLTPSGVKLVEQHHKGGWDNEIVPRSPTAVTRLQNSFQKVFQSYTTRS